MSKNTDFMDRDWSDPIVADNTALETIAEKENKANEHEMNIDDNKDNVDIDEDMDNMIDDDFYDDFDGGVE